MDAHNQKEEELQKKKSHYSDLFLIAAIQTPPRQHQKSSFSNRDALKKETLHKHHHHPIIYHTYIIGFHLGENPCSQNNHCQALPIKARPWVFTLQDFELLMCDHPHFLIPLLQVMNHQASSSSPQRLKPPLQVLRNSASVSFSASDFTTNCKTRHMMATDNRASPRSL
jgi:hypothetical protein